MGWTTGTGHRAATLLLGVILFGCGAEGEGDGGGGPGGSSADSLYGVPADGCAPGFDHGGDHGCRPILPPSCPPGSMAIPGDTECREVAPCAEGTWGDIPVDGTTQFVDGSYVGGNSNGTAAQPWTTLSEALDAAAEGAIIAIAAGSYAERVLIDNQGVRLWGRCPALVEIVATGPASATVFVGHSASTELRDLAIRSDTGAGVIASGANLLLERVWIHHTIDRGLSLESSWGPTTIVLRDSLVENVTDLGLFSAGANLTVERSVVRDVAFEGQVGTGGGLQLIPHTDQGARTVAMVRQSLIERTRGTAVSVSGSDVTLEGCAVMDTQPGFDGGFGNGLTVGPDPSTGSSVVQVHGSTFERNHASGIIVSSSTLTAANVTIRATQPQQSDGGYGRGLHVQAEPSSLQPGDVVVTTSLVEDSHDIGVLSIDSALTLDRLLVRRTLARSDGSFGDGLALVSILGLATGVVTNSLVQDSARAGLGNFGGQVTIGGDRFQCNAVDLNGELYEERDYVYTDQGGNSCGCPEANQECQVLSANLEPPTGL